MDTLEIVRRVKLSDRTTLVVCAQDTESLENAHTAADADINATVLETYA